MQATDEHRYVLIPAVRDLVPAPGHFQLESTMAITINDESLRDVASGFARFIAIPTGLPLPVTISGEPEARAINFVLRRAEPLLTESYELAVTHDKINIVAFDLAGAFYATQTLRQLLPVEIERKTASTHQSWSVPLVKIQDNPRYAYRGMHLDVSRHFFSVDTVKRYIDLMAAHKMNFFHWHLTDDQGWRIEIKKYPRLTQVGAWRSETIKGHTLGHGAVMDGKRHGGFYTQDEIREVVDYAAARFVTVIPEIDLPGHASALLAAYPQLGCIEKDYRVQTSFGIFQDVLCPTEVTFEFLATVFAEIASLFPGPYIHIGGDEVVTTQWAACQSCTDLMLANGMDEYNQLQGYFVRRLDELVARFGKKLIGWDDILEGDVASTATVTAWRGPDKVSEALRRGHDVIVASTQTYFDFYQSQSRTEPMAIHGLATLQGVYEFQVEPEGLAEGYAGRLLGAQGNLWSEYISTEEQLDYMSIPRMSALAEILWSPKDKHSWAGFIRRLGYFFARLDSMGVKASRSVYAVKISTSTLAGSDAVRVELSAAGPGHRIRYTTDGTRPGIESPLFEMPLTLDSAATVRAAAEDPETGSMYGDARLSYHPHKALGRRVVFETVPDASWGDVSSYLLTDGLIRSDQIFRHEEWAGFSSGRMNAVVDLSVATHISEVTIGFDATLHRRLHPPTDIEVFVSNDDLEWRSVGSLDRTQIDTRKRDVTLRFDAVEARYIRVIVSTNDKIYSAELEDTVTPTLYIDEIIVH